MRALHILCVTALFMAAGCSAHPATVAVPALPQAMPVDPPGGSAMLTFNTFAGDALHAMLLLRMDSGGGILTASFVDIHDLDKTSAFGRVASQQVASRIGQHGFRIIEARLTGDLAMIPGPGDGAGEFMLSRETARLLSDTYAAAAVLVGFYSDRGNNIFVSARVVRLADNAVMAAYEYYVPRDSDVRPLLAGAGGSGASGGDAIWAYHNAREQAFPPDKGRMGPGYDSSRAARAGGAGDSPRAVPRAVLHHAAPAVAPAARAAAAKPVPQKLPPSASKQEASAPAAQAAPVAQAAPDPRQTPGKDAPAPSGVPGGNI